MAVLTSSRKRDKEFANFGGINKSMSHKIPTRYLLIFFSFFAIGFFFPNLFVKTFAQGGTDCSIGTIGCCEYLVYVHDDCLRV